MTDCCSCDLAWQEPKERWFSNHRGGGRGAGGRCLGRAEPNQRGGAATLAINPWCLAAPPRSLGSVVGKPPLLGPLAAQRLNL